MYLVYPHSHDDCLKLQSSSLLSTEKKIEADLAQLLSQMENTVQEVMNADGKAKKKPSQM